MAATKASQYVHCQYCEHMDDIHMNKSILVGNCSELHREMRANCRRICKGFEPNERALSVKDQDDFSNEFIWYMRSNGYSIGYSELCLTVLRSKLLDKYSIYDVIQMKYNQLLDDVKTRHPEANITLFRHIARFVSTTDRFQELKEAV